MYTGTTSPKFGGIWGGGGGGGGVEKYLIYIHTHHDSVPAISTPV